MNGIVLPTATAAGFGVIAIDVSEITVSVTPGDVTVPNVAVMLVVPPATPVASPPEAAIVAVAGVPEAHVTVDVISAVVLSLYVPVAVNCCVAPTFRCAGDAGVTAIEVRVFVDGCLRPLHPTAMKPTKSGKATAMKRRRRDFIFPPQTVTPKILEAHLLVGDATFSVLRFRGLGSPPKLRPRTVRSPCCLIVLLTAL